MFNIVLDMIYTLYNKFLWTQKGQTFKHQSIFLRSCMYITMALQWQQYICAIILVCFSHDILSTHHSEETFRENRL